MAYTITLIPRCSHVEKIQCEGISVTQAADNDFHANASKISPVVCNSHGDALITVVVAKMPIGKWLARFYDQYEDESGLCQKYVVRSLDRESAGATQ